MSYNLAEPLATILPNSPFLPFCQALIRQLLPGVKTLGQIIPAEFERRAPGPRLRRAHHLLDEPSRQLLWTTR